MLALARSVGSLAREVDVIVKALEDLSTSVNLIGGAVESIRNAVLSRPSVESSSSVSRAFSSGLFDGIHLTRSHKRKVDSQTKFVMEELTSLRHDVAREHQLDIKRTDEVDIRDNLRGDRAIGYKRRVAQGGVSKKSILRRHNTSSSATQEETSVSSEESSDRQHREVALLSTATTDVVSRLLVSESEEEETAQLPSLLLSLHQETTSRKRARSCDGSADDLSDSTSGSCAGARGGRGGRGPCGGRGRGRN
ncbi:hypothetical protein BDB00DRAFT_878938 [Zychaea mexicana]|uniref:uncharacterized protein n=1 Tax=Zychaea mexicana TaxID=64656 RepID=UPI0022FEC4AE|nr:uncharacterized protein BDB00DRAFT_878938 [Zychaea mexicana]KAI9484358.1 hypothetical protein BDB00DRAFT_878938 [Zychaea mexicana]